ncbi:DNA uptake porin HofQ [Lonsdalea quercina]|uniref:DNA uptake porin HofQ n=1 Tax=Lonsdalea quercina TaxID=71657 RepID=UPI00397528B2
MMFCRVLCMRKATFRYVLLVCLCFHQPVMAQEALPVSLAFDDVPVARALQALADHQRLNLVVAPGVEGNISLQLNNVPWQQALDITLKMADLTLEREGDVLMVYTRGKFSDVPQTEREVQHTEPLKNASLMLQYAEASDVAAGLQGQRGTLLSERGRVTADKRTNTLLIRDEAAAVAEIKAWIREMDKPLAQVRLTAHIVTIGSEQLESLGVNWGLGERVGPGKGLSVNNFNIDLPITTPAIKAGIHLARLDGRLLDLELQALEQENAVEIIASPRLFTAHRQTASIKQGTEIPYQVSSGASGSTSIEFKEAVLGMEVTPRVLPQNRISLNLLISQNMPGRAIKQGEGEILAIDKQEIQTQVTVTDGETIVLGGIFQQQKNQAENRVPGLGQLPVVGGLFKSRSQQNTRRELVIFITPTLIHDAPQTEL